MVCLPVRGLTYLLASIYLDVLHSPTPDWLSDIVDFADDKGYALILSVDTNAHSQLFGPSTNPRGEQLEEFLFAHGLTVENLGLHPTFHAHRAGRLIGTHIDATFSKRVTEMTHWRVCEEFNASDHYTIRFDLGKMQPQTKLIRPWKQPDTFILAT